MGISILQQPLMSFNFVVSTQLGFFRASKVSSIEQSVNLEAFCEGGVNDYVHALPQPQSELKKLVFERGYCEQYLSLKMSCLLGIRQEQPMIICIFDRSMEHILKTYLIDGWMVSKWKISDLDAQNGGIMLETVEVVYETLESEDLI